MSTLMNVMMDTFAVAVGTNLIQLAVDHVTKVLLVTMCILDNIEEVTNVSIVDIRQIRLLEVLAIEVQLVIMFICKKMVNYEEQ